MLPTLFLGMATDAWDRRKMIVAILAAAVAADIGAATAATYSQLLATRVVAGTAAMSVLPLVYSIVSDMYSSEARGAVASAVMAAMGAGTIIGQVLAGLMGPTLGWRSAFLLSAPLGAVLCPLIAYRLVVPPRGAAEGGGDGGAGGGGGGWLYGVARVWSTPTNVMLFAQCIPGSVPWGPCQRRGGREARAGCGAAAAAARCAEGGRRGGQVGGDTGGRFVAPCGHPPMPPTRRACLVPYSQA